MPQICSIDFLCWQTKSLGTTGVEDIKVAEQDLLNLHYDGKNIKAVICLKTAPTLVPSFTLCFACDNALFQAKLEFSIFVGEQCK